MRLHTGGWSAAWSAPVIALLAAMPIERHNEERDCSRIKIAKAEVMDVGGKEGREERKIFHRSRKVRRTESLIPGRARAWVHGLNEKSPPLALRACACTSSLSTSPDVALPVVRSRASPFPGTARRKTFPCRVVAD